MGKGRFRVILMRGISGSGKNTYISKHFPEAFVCSADDYFVDPSGNYNFDRRKLGSAHGGCKEKFIKALHSREPLIIINNTNTMLREMNPYVKPARRQGYRIECIRLDVPVEVAHARNVHGVPYGAVKAMAERMANVPTDWHEKVISYE